MGAQPHPPVPVPVVLSQRSQFHRWWTGDCCGRRSAAVSIRQKDISSKLLASSGERGQPDPTGFLQGSSRSRGCLASATPPLGFCPLVFQLFFCVFLFFLLCNFSRPNGTKSGLASEPRLFWSFGRGLNLIKISESSDHKSFAVFIKQTGEVKRNFEKSENALAFSASG